jgi:protein-S-isoprenylcysteine O-methyltransferase Ste14
MSRLDPDDRADRIAIARNAAGMGLVLCLMAIVVLGYIVARHPFMPIRIVSAIGIVVALVAGALYASRFRTANREIEEARRRNDRNHDPQQSR